MIEILAPAGGMESVIAAINTGADAIYLGGKTLNARRSAANFTDDELKFVVEMAHIRNVKIYLALNTAVFEDEMISAAEAVKNACELGVDAIIVSDIGIAAMIRQFAPNMPIHASTQMGIHNIDGVKAAEKLGFTRVVLSRELSKKEIKEIIDNTMLEIEVFVHGALCMCFSGSCYLSSIIGQRSGNRGMCAQPCRMPMGIGNVTHALSLKDLSLVDRIQELMEIGVHCLKIEGRMKRPEYVAAAVNACKQAVDGGFVDFEALRSVYSRSGFTDGYFSGKMGKEMFGVRRKEDVVSAEPILKSLSNLYKTEYAHVAISFELIMHQDQEVTLKVKDENGNISAVSGGKPEIAINKPTTEEKAIASLSKLGGTPFYVKEIVCNIGENLIYPVSKLNELRREALSVLIEKRAYTPPKAYKEVVTQKKERVVDHSRAIRVRVSTATQLTRYMSDNSEYIIAPPDEIEKIAKSEYLNTELSKLIVEIPRMVFGTRQSEVRAKLIQLKEIGVEHALVNNIGAVNIAIDLGFTIHGGFGLNVTNSMGVQTLKELGSEDCTVSFETDLVRAGKMMCEIPLGIVAYGYLPLMIMRNCPIKNEMQCEACKENPLVDRLGNKFSLMCDNGDTQLINTVPLYLADKLSELRFSFLILHFTKENADECRRITQQYIEGGVQDNITRGLYYRRAK